MSGQPMTIIGHPWTLFIIQLLVFSVIGFAQPSSILQYAGIALTVGLMAQIHGTMHDLEENRASKVWIASMSVCIPLTAVANYLVDRTSYSTLDPASHTGHKAGPNTSMSGATASQQMLARPKWSRFWFAVEQALSRRRIGTPRQVKGVPPFSSKDRGYVPSRRSFLISTSASIICCYLIVDISSVQKAPDPALMAVDKQYLLSRFKEVTLEELIVRIAVTFGFYLSASLNIMIIPYFFSWIAVASGMSEPAAWPPPFGSVRELYTIRQFWGVFWHQYLRVTFNGIATLVTRLLHIPSGTLIDRYSRILISFFVSGLIHIGAAWGYTATPSESGAIRFFLTQALGIMAEDAVQAAYYRFSGESKGTQVSRWRKTVGFVWLAAFLTWSTPVWVYPQVRNFRPGVDDMWPSLVRYLMARREIKAVSPGAKMG